MLGASNSFTDAGPPENIIALALNSDILENYEVSNFSDFSNNINNLESNIAATILKVQE